MNLSPRVPSRAQGDSLGTISAIRDEFRGCSLAGRGAGDAKPGVGVQAHLPAPGRAGRGEIKGYLKENAVTMLTG